MKKICQAMCGFILLAPNALAQKHVHDEGQILVSQEDSQWHFQFIIPAVNAFGFEHLPESESELETVKAFVANISSPDNVLSLNSSCKLVSVKESVTDAYLSAGHDGHDKHHGHDKHDDEHKEHHEHDHHDDHDEHKEHHDHEEHEKNHDHDHEGHDHDSSAEHRDAEFELLFNCKEDITKADIKLFAMLNNMQEFSVQWITEKSQGAGWVTPARNTVDFTSR